MGKVSAFHSNIKPVCFLSISQTCVQILGDIRSQQVPVHNSCCCCDSTALKLPQGAWCQSWFGFVTHPLMHFCIVCYGRNETWQKKEKKKGRGVCSCVFGIWFICWVGGKSGLDQDWEQNKNLETKGNPIFWGIQEMFCFFFLPSQYSIGTNIFKGRMTAWPLSNLQRWTRPPVSSSRAYLKSSQSELPILYQPLGSYWSPHDWCGLISQAVTLSWWGDTLWSPF